VSHPRAASLGLGPPINMQHKKMMNIKYLFSQLFKYKNPDECSLFGIPNKILKFDIDILVAIIIEYNISSVGLYHLIHSFVGSEKFKEIYDLTNEEYKYVI